LVADVLAGKLRIAEFCSQFEHVYNMELDKRTLLSDEAEAFAELFEQVIWYSPYPDERERIKQYHGDKEIREAVGRAADKLDGEPTN
jgi:hypothetical protein